MRLEGDVSVGKALQVTQERARSVLYTMPMGINPWALANANAADPARTDHA